MTGTESDIITPHKTPKHLASSNTQALPALSDTFARIECELNQFQSAIRTPKARAADLGTADWNIDAAKRLVLSMLTHRNTLAPISILPAEILARIFHFTAFSEQHYFPTLMLGWVYVTHICRHWRQVALDDSTLWTHFCTVPWISTHFCTISRNKYWIAEQLSRARNAPLVIELDGSLEMGSLEMGADTLSLFTLHISHTRELYLTNISRTLYSAVIQGINTQNALALEHLELSVSDFSPISMRSFVVHPFFKEALPNLRIFCVSQILFPWSLVPRGRLTQLKVTHSEEVSTVTSKKSQQDDLNHLIDLLVDCPLLEVLTLENCLPAMLSESSGGQTIHLPFLSRLSLRGPSSRVTNLLKMLKLSSSTILHLDCTPEFGATHNEHLIFPILMAHFNNPHPVKFRSFKMNMGSVGGLICIIASTSLPISPIPRPHVIQADNDAEFRLSFHGVVELNNRADILRQACNVLSLSNVEFLSLYSPSPNQFIDWSEVFQHCAEVTTVQIYGRGTIGLLEAFTPPKRANTVTMARGKGRERKGGDHGGGVRAQVPNHDDHHVLAPVHIPIFPKLTCLSLEALDFAVAVPGSGVLYDLVLNTVQHCNANETPLTTLCIDHCEIRQKQAKAFEKVVPDFRWDDDYVDNRTDYDYSDSEFNGSADDYWDPSDPDVLWAIHRGLAQTDSEPEL